MNSTYSITRKFQVTIPKKLRDEVGLRETDRVRFERKGDDIVLKRVPTIADVQKMNQQWLRERGIKSATQADIDDARAKFIREKMTW